MSKQTLLFLLLSLLLRASCQDEAADAADAAGAAGVAGSDLEVPGLEGSDPDAPVSWKYGTDWDRDIFPQCFVTQQSPIALVSADAVKEGVPVVTFNWGVGNRPINVTIWSDQKTVLVMSDGFSETTKVDEELYKFTMMYLHWGSDKTKGSEHTVDGTTFAGEIEIYHRKSVVAGEESEKLLIVSIPLKVGVNTPKGLKQFQATFQSILESPSGSIIIPFTKKQLRLERLLPKGKKDEYFYYTGSLSKPPCTPAIERVVLKNALKVGPAFLQALRDLNLSKDGTSMSDNFRLPQPTLSDTVVYKSFD